MGQKTVIKLVFTASLLASVCTLLVPVFMRPPPSLFKDFWPRIPQPEHCVIVLPSPQQPAAPASPSWTLWTSFTSTAIRLDYNGKLFLALHLHNNLLFSQPTIVPYEEFDVVADIKAIRKACKGFGKFGNIELIMSVLSSSNAPAYYIVYHCAASVFVLCSLQGLMSRLSSTSWQTAAQLSVRKLKTHILRSMMMWVSFSNTQNIISFLP